MKKLFFYLIITLIILFSFFHHSSLYSPFLNSDDAVIVLMIHDFHLPQDLYYWNANRYGSLIPLMGQFFYKILHCSPVASESFTHYLLLIAGFIGFASLYRSKFIQLIFAVVWFLPPLRMIDIVKVPLGEQYALIGISVFILNKLYTDPIIRYRLKEHVFLLLTTLLFIVSVWVADIAISTIFIIVLYHVLLFIRNKQIKPCNILLKKPEPFYIIFGLFTGALFIYYAKKNAVSQENYYDFFDLKTIIASGKIFLGTVIDLFRFRIKEPFTSLYSYLLLFPLFFVILKHRKIKFSKNHSKWAIIFILDLVIFFLIIISSKWAYLNGVPRRYFICNYISFWIVFLMTIESLKEIKYKGFLNCFILITVLIGGLGTLYNFKYISPKSLRPTIAIASEFKRLGKIGILSEYWNSYINAAPDPDNIKATPNDKSEVRKQSLVDSVFAQPQIYVIRDMWMDSFPDTLEQFGYVLLKNGSEFRISNCQVCNYKKIKLHRIIPLEKLICDTSQLIKDEPFDKMMLFVSDNCQQCKQKHLVYGPYMPLGIGNFTVRFYLKISNAEIEESIALLDIVADWGVTKLAVRTLSKSDFASEDFQYIDIDFATIKRYASVEFRIFYYGHADLYFKHIELIEK